MPGPSRKGKGKSKGRGGRGGGTRSQYGRGGAGRGGGRGLSARGGPGSFVGGAGGGGGGFGGFTGMSSAAEGMAHMPNPTLGPQFLPPGLSLEDALQGDPYGLNFGPHGSAWEAYHNPSIQQQVPGYTGPTGPGIGGFTGGVGSTPPTYQSLRDVSGTAELLAAGLGGGGGGGGTYTQPRPKGGAGEWNPRTTSVNTSPSTGITSTVSKGGGEGKYVNITPGQNTSDFDLAQSLYSQAGVVLAKPGSTQYNAPGGGAPHFNPNYGGGGGGGKPTATTHRWGGARGTGWATNPNNPNYGQPRPGVGPSGGNAGGAAGGGTEPTYNPNYGNQSLQDQKPKDKQVLNRYAGKGGL
jgi:hypothetical protein